MEDSGFCYTANEQRLLARVRAIQLGILFVASLPRRALSLPEKP